MKLYLLQVKGRMAYFGQPRTFTCSTLFRSRESAEASSGQFKDKCCNTDVEALGALDPAHSEVIITEMDVEEPTPT